jgi:hypothetical protein
MEDLLQRVRDRLGVMEPEIGSDAGASLPPHGSRRDEQYESTLEILLLLLRDAEQLGELVAPERLHSLTAEQHDDLQSILSKALRQLWSCKAALERVKPAAYGSGDPA